MNVHDTATDVGLAIAANTVQAVTLRAAVLDAPIEERIITSDLRSLVEELLMAGTSSKNLTINDVHFRVQTVRCGESVSLKVKKSLVVFLVRGKLSIKSGGDSTSLRVLQLATLDDDAVLTCMSATDAVCLLIGAFE